MTSLHLCQCLCRQTLAPLIIHSRWTHLASNSLKRRLIFESYIHKTFTIIQPRRCFSFSRLNKAIHPLLWVILRPLSQIVAILFGRAFRRWWLSLPNETRKEHIENFFKNRGKLLITAGSVSSLLSLYYYYHVEKCQFTGRWRFVTVTRRQFKEMCDLQSKMLLQHMKPHILPEYDFRVMFVKKVAKNLLKANLDIDTIKNFNWSIYVVDAKLPNVVVVPNGYIFVFTGMLDNFDNEDQLGIVLGHEMAHAILGHGLEQASWNQLMDSLMLIFIAIIWAAVPGVAAAITHWLTYTALQIVTQLPHSRKLETEADDFGLRLAAKACFDPREVYAFWIAAMMKSKVEDELSLPDFLSTHPNHGDRAARLEPIIEDALKLRAQCNCPGLKTYDPRILAKVKKEMIEQQLALKGNIL